MMTVTPRDQMTRISTFGEAQEVLRSADFRNTLTTRRSNAITGFTIGGLVHDEHMQRRRAEMEVFSRASLVDYEFADVVPAIAEALAGGADRLDLIDVMRGGLLRVSARVIGLDDVTSDTRTRQLRDVADRIGEAASVEWTTRDPDEVIAAALAAKEEFLRGLLRAVARSTTRDGGAVRLR
ncbi:cytochrome P450 [Nocardioides sp. TF02-7]|uniref:cytochrome P450 n=1 Tax=Nocardioides sp. TF02-7 TaxID=2917724 RepID=UPI001F050704|nr:cytochrome P450 [Nocardioides sp. TF02-7]UMG91181.1 cytochrome P450 [Nocardioides sp. TF02-7]